MLDSILSPGQIVFCFLACLYLAFAAFPLSCFLPDNRWGKLARYGSPGFFALSALILCVGSSCQAHFFSLALFVAWPFLLAAAFFAFVLIGGGEAGPSALFSQDFRLPRLIVLGVLSLVSLGCFLLVWIGDGGKAGDLTNLKALAVAASQFSPERQEVFSAAVADAICDGEFTRWELVNRPYPLSLVELSSRLQEEEDKEHRKKELEEMFGVLKCSSGDL